MSRPRALSRCAIRSAVLGLAFLLSASRFAAAQELGGGPVTSEQRDQLYREVALEVAALERQGNLLKKVVRLVQPTVVHIDARKSQMIVGRTRQRNVDEAGSGVIIQFNRKTYVLTNRHVIKNSSLGNVRIRLSDGREVHPVKVWSDRETDVAVLAVTAADLVGARLGDSNKVEIGDFVLAIGSPFGLSHSITYGIVSAKGRRDLVLGEDTVRFQDFIQTDAAINPGNSGGPLFNLRGELIGINTAIASNSGGNEGIGFTIPINMFMSVATQLVEKGKVARAFLGVHLDSQFDRHEAVELGLHRTVGARVTAITPKSPADRAKLLVDDVIVKFNDVPIQDDNHLINVVSLTPVDKEVPVLVVRRGKRVTIRVKVSERAKFEANR